MKIVLIEEIDFVDKICFVIDGKKVGKVFCDFFVVSKLFNKIHEYGHLRCTQKIDENRFAKLCKNGRFHGCVE